MKRVHIVLSELRIRFVFHSVYVDLQYDDISLTFIVGPVWLHACMLREWEGDGNAGVGTGGGNFMQGSHYINTVI